MLIKEAMTHMLETVGFGVVVVCKARLITEEKVVLYRKLVDQGWKKASRYQKNVFIQKQIAMRSSGET